MATQTVQNADSFDLEVVDYQLTNGDATYYNNHIFTIKVWIQQHMYVIHRSYAAFCELDCRLRKQYARSNLPALKLAGALAAIKIAKKNSIIKDHNVVITYPPELDPERGQARLFRRVDNAEAIGHKKKYLTGYLQALLQIPEVVLSDVLLYFLDEESKDGEPVVETAEDTLDSREVNVLLNGAVMTSCVVRVDKRHDLAVPANCVVVWAFTTLNHDIGFSISYKKREVYKYQRCESHQKIIKGHFEMHTEGDVTFMWDNSYSRWRSKTLHFVVRTVSMAEFALAQNIAAQGIKDKAQFTVQRNMVKAALTSQSSRILQARGNIIASTALPHTASMKGMLQSGSMGNLSSRGGALVDTASSGGTLSHRSSEGGAGADDASDTALSGQEQQTSHLHGSYKAGTPSSVGIASSPGHHTRSTRQVTGTVEAAQGNIPEFLDLAQAMKELQKLRNEKKTLQQALGECETALVTERNIAAQYTQQYEVLTQRYSAQEDELTSLKAEFELFRENYYNEMEAKMAETLAAFSASAHVNTAVATAENGTAADEGLDESMHGSNRGKARGTRAGDSEGPTPLASPLRGSTANGSSPRPFSHDTGAGTGASASRNKHRETGTDAPTGSDPSPATLGEYAESGAEITSEISASEVSFNQLLNVNATELADMPPERVVELYLHLQDHVQLMVRRGYLTKELEQLLGKLKNEKKQLKAYAIQTKQSLDKLTTQYIHIEADKAQLLAQVRELRDLVALLETDRKGLREHISQLLDNDTTPAKGSAVAGQDREAGGGEGQEDSPPVASRGHSRSFHSSAGGSYDSQDYWQSSERARPAPTVSSGSGRTPEGTSSLRNLWRSGLAAMSSFDISEIVESTIGGESTTNNTAQYSRQGGAPPRRNSEPLHASLQSPHPPQPATEASEGDREAVQVGREDAVPTAPICSTTLVISAEDLELAAAETVTGTGAPTAGRQGSRDSHEGTDQESAHLGTLSRTNSAGPGVGAGEDRTGSSGAQEEGDGGSGSQFTKVTEQLYGILPTWGQLNALRTKSLV